MSRAKAHQSSVSARKTALVAGMASYLDAAAITAFAACLVQFEKTLRLDAVQIGAAAATLTVTMAMGAAVGGRLGDRHGRRPIFVATMVLIVLGAGVLALATSFPVLLAGAMMLGFGIGADLPVSLATISEAADDHNRGRLLGLSNLLWLVGMVGTGVLTAVFGDAGHLAILILFGHIAAVGTIVMLLRLSIPESPLWLAARTAAERVGARRINATTSFAALLRPPLRTPFLGLTLFYAFTCILANTNGQYLVYMMTKSGAFTVASAVLFSACALPVVLVGYVWFLKIADTPQRFQYFQVGGVAFIAAPVAIAVFGLTKPAIAAMLLLSAIGSSFAFEGIYRVWSQQSFPTLVRGTAQGWIIAITRLVAAASAAVTPTLIGTIGVRGLYAALTVTTFIGIAIGWSVFRTRDQISAFDAATG